MPRPAGASITRAAVSVLVAACFACAGPVRPTDTVIFASGTDLESANPLVTIHPLSRQIQRHVLFVTLTRYNAMLAPEAYFARAWRWSPDRRVLTLTLASHLRWHDGTPTTARDAAFTVLRARDPRTGYARAADLAMVDTVTARSPEQLEIRFTSAQREVPAILSELPIVPAHLLDTVAGPDMRRTAFASSPVGNGPFRFVRRVAGQRWEFERNDDFPAELGGPPQVRRLVVAVVDEPTTKFAGLAAGELDFAGIGATMADLARRDRMIRVLDYPVLFSTGLVFNSHRAPFDDARVRRAVDLSIDRARIVAAALAGFGTPASGPVPPENPFALDAEPAFDTTRADALLEAAGWRRGPDGMRARGRAFDIELLTVGSGDNAIEQLIQADLAERGIRVRIRQLELGAFLTRARAPQKDFDMLVTGVPGDLALSYVRAMFETNQGGGSLDYAAFHRPDIDSAFAAARRASTNSALHSAWLDVQRQLALHTPVAWLYHSRGLQGMSARMQNVVMDLRGELTSVSRWSIDEAPPGKLVALPAPR